MALKILNNLISFGRVAVLARIRGFRRSEDVTSATAGRSHEMAPRCPVGGFGLLVSVHHR